MFLIRLIPILTGLGVFGDVLVVIEVFNVADYLSLVWWRRRFQATASSMSA
jgi:hypothetical protein